MAEHPLPSHDELDARLKGAGIQLSDEELEFFRGAYPEFLDQLKLLYTYDVTEETYPFDVALFKGPQ
jgi:hypothetical protein